MSYKSYQTLDLIFLTIIALVGQWISSLAFSTFTGTYFYMSFTLIISTVAIFKWGYKGCVVYVLTAVISNILKISMYDYNIIQALIASLFIIPTVIYINKIGKEKILKSWLLFCIYLTIVHFSLSLGNGFVAILEGNQFFANFVTSFTFTIFSLVMNAAAYFAIRNKKDLFLSGTEYIEKIQRGNLVDE